MSLKALKRSIILCWIILGICLIIKLCGGNWFEVIVNNKSFINFCNVIDNNHFLKILISCITMTITMLLYIKSIVPNLLKEHFIYKRLLQSIFIICVILLNITRYFLTIILNYQFIGIIIDLLQFTIFPFILLMCTIKCKRKILYVIIATIIGTLSLPLFQYLCLIIKNVTIKVETNTLTALILMIDYYIILLLTYLYSKKKGGYIYMGIFGGWFFSKTIDQLNALKIKKTKQLENLQKEINEIDKAIAIKKNEENKL